MPKLTGNLCNVSPVLGALLVYLMLQRMPEVPDSRDKRR